jgi:hypothetical protein
MKKIIEKINTLNIRFIKFDLLVIPIIKHFHLILQSLAMVRYP